jgi:hypothetical protein
MKTTRLHFKFYHSALKDLENIHALSQSLAHYFPAPDCCVTGIHELLTNAVEHGNLAIGYKKKMELLHEGKWLEEMARRLSMSEYRHRSVDIRLACNSDECSLIITDEGRGFCWKDFTRRPVLGRQVSGRGLQIAFASGFHQLSFNDVGNAATCSARYRR